MLSSKLDEAPVLEPSDTREPPGKSCGQAPTERSSSIDGSPPVLSPSPKFREPAKRTQDDIHIESPTTPRRPAFTARGLSLQMPARDLMAANAILSPTPLSPKLDTNTYGSPASVIPRRSRGLDFSRAATNLHHSTLAEKPSPDSSPTLSGRAMIIPNRRSGQESLYNELGISNANSVWANMAKPERNTMSSSLGSTHMMASDSSSDSSNGDDLMDADDIDESILTTPQVRQTGAFGTLQHSPGNWIQSQPSPAVSSLMNFQQRHKLRGKARKGSSSLGIKSMQSPKSRSPPMTRTMDVMPGGYFGKELAGSQHQRRESISWAANQLHISGSESDDGTLRSTLENGESLPSGPGRQGVIRRAVTRRGNMLPKTKGFARIRAALAEEGAPVETEVRREADVIRQVRESDIDLEPRRHDSVSGTAQSSPMFGPAVLDALEDIPEADLIMAAELSTPGSEHQISSSFKHQAARNSRGSKDYWESLEDSYRTPPPPAFLPRGSLSGISDDASMNTPPSTYLTTIWQMPSIEHTDTASSSGRSSTPQPNSSIPSAAEISRKVNNKRRRDDDFDPASFKRRAVSPGMSVHNSPVLQSPMQRDVNPWGSRPSPSGNGGNTGSMEKPGSVSSASGTPAAESGGRQVNASKRVGYQGMVDTNDGLMNMSID